MFKSVVGYDPPSQFEPMPSSMHKAQYAQWIRRIGSPGVSRVTGEFLHWKTGAVIVQNATLSILSSRQLNSWAELKSSPCLSLGVSDGEWPHRSNGSFNRTREDSVSPVNK